MTLLRDFGLAGVGLDSEFRRGEGEGKRGRVRGLSALEVLQNHWGRKADTFTNSHKDRPKKE